MLKWNILTLAMAVSALGLVVQRTPAAVLEDDFDDGTLADFPSPNVVGATLTNPGSGGNPDGYLQAFRDVGNTGYTLSEKYTGDWEELTGASGIVFSVDLRIEDAGSPHTLRLEISNPTFSDLWRKDIFTGDPFPWDSNDGWVTFNYPIDVNWTDEEANENGWVRTFPSGSPKSFSEVLRNVKGPLTYFVLAGDDDPNTPGTHSFMTGLDNVRLAPAVAPLDGDLNTDGFVGQDDLNIVLANWGQMPPGDLRADPSGDGFVGQDDLNPVLGNWGQGTPPAALSAVPEPQSLTLLAIGIAGMFTYYKRRQNRKELKT